MIAPLSQDLRRRLAQAMDKGSSAREAERPWSPSMTVRLHAAQLG